MFKRRFARGAGAAFAALACALAAACASDPDLLSADDRAALDPDRCLAAGLDWRSGSLTEFESYPDPGSEECVEFSGCEYVGEFAACAGKKSEEWVAAHHIAAVFPDFDALALHDLCLRAGDSYLVVTVLDACSDDDCDGCCTENLGDAEQLVDLEKYTLAAWGVEDGGGVEWADLGPTQGGGCD